MPHSVDGFYVRYTGRRSWKAERRLHNRTLDIIPVAWTKGIARDPSSKEVTLEVWYQNPEELKKQMADPNPFVVALAKAKDDRESPPVFDQFVAIFRVVATGKIIREKSIETTVLERVRAKERVDA